MLSDPLFASPFSDFIRNCCSVSPSKFFIESLDFLHVFGQGKHKTGESTFKDSILMFSVFICCMSCLYVVYFFIQGL